MFENEKAVRELEIQLSLFETAARAYEKKARWWLVGLTLLLALVSWLVTGSGWMALGVGLASFLLMWSGLASTTRQHQRKIRGFYGQLYRLRQNRESGNGRTADDRVFYWPDESDQPFS